MGESHLEIDFTTVILIVSAISVLFLQLLLCFKAKRTFIKFIPIVLLAALTIVFSICSAYINGWDGLGYLFFSLLFFVLVIIWNEFAPWPIEWWGHYFFITTLLIPGIVAFFSTFWFGIGGAVDLWRLFRDLEHRVVDPLDNGTVEGNVSLSDKAKFAAAEAQKDSLSSE